MKILARLIPITACPICGNSKYIVVEHQIDYFLTDKYGDVIDYRNESDHAVGQCLTCGAIIKMIPLKDKFIPSNPIRELLYDYPKDQEHTECIPSPMERGN